MNHPRNRAWHAVAVLVVIAAGLASRRFPVLAPVFGKYPGDALWAVMVYLGWAVVFPRASGARIALLASASCLVIECLKLWQAPWLASLRHTTVGHLVLGHVFSRANLLAYAVGIAVVFLVEHIVRARRDVT